MFPTTDKSESKAVLSPGSSRLEPDWAEQSGGGQICTIRAVGDRLGSSEDGLVRKTVWKGRRRGGQESGSLSIKNFSVLKVLESLGVELNTSDVGKRKRQGKVDCSVCKRFYTAGYLGSHMERKHGEKKKDADKGIDVEEVFEKKV